MEEKKLSEVLKDIFDSLTGEQKQKMLACQTPEELTELLNGLGVALPDEALDMVAGGDGCSEASKRRVKEILDQMGGLFRSMHSL